MKDANTDARVIYWAVDPDFVYDDESEIMKMLLMWSRQLGFAVQPVSVIAAESLKMLPIDREIVAAYLQDFFPSEFRNPDIIISADSSTRKRAYHLARYAEKKRASYIFVNSRDKISWNPFHLGGFAEALLATSWVPVMVINERAYIHPLQSPILFPTDFAISSRRSLPEVFNIAKECKAEVFIYNQLEWFSQLTFKIGFSGSEARAQIYFEKLYDDRMYQAESWAARLRSQGLKTHILVKNEHHLLAQDIAENEKQIHAGLIVMATEGGHIAQSVLGSSVRDVVLLANCPVLVINRPMERHLRAYEEVSVRP